MNTLSISRFKAFKNEVKIASLDANKNLVVCGENGAGKSSLFDAIKLSVYYERLLSENVQIPDTDPGYKNEVDTWKQRQFQNKSQNDEPFSITIDGVSYERYPENVSQSVYMISAKDLQTRDKIVLTDLFQSVFYPQLNGSHLIQPVVNEILSAASEVLNTRMAEEIVLSTDPQNGEKFVVSIQDEVRGFTEHDNLRQYFNEAKLHIIQLVLLLVYSKYVSMDGTVGKMLVLDDVVSSLDSGNRIFLTRYLLEEFQDYQKVILTHNVGFFNLIRHCVRRYGTDAECAQWVFQTLYEYQGECRIYQYKVEKNSASELLTEVLNTESTDDEKIRNLGNLVRKRFEIATVELSRIFSVGDMASTEEVLTKMVNPGSKLYLSLSNTGNHDLLTVSDLIEKIDKTIEEEQVDDNHLREVLRQIIADYNDNEDLKVLRKSLNENRIFFFFLLHPMSHGLGDVTFSYKELKVSAALLRVMESIINKVYTSQRGQNVNNVG